MINFCNSFKPHDSASSHQHEDMDAMCELRTEIARLASESARLKAQRKPLTYCAECMRPNPVDGSFCAHCINEQP